MSFQHIRFLLRCVALLLIFAAGSFLSSGSSAQTLPDDQPGIDDTVPVPPIAAPLTNPPNEEETAAAPAALDAAPVAAMNYQGVLKDAEGQRLTGVYDMVFQLYNTADAGAKVWGDETHNDVPVDDGLFAVVLGETLPFDVVNDLDEQLYLQVTVEGVVLPRQPLRAVPYAMSLVVGSTIRGATAGVGQYGLDIRNSGGRGLYVDGDGNGIYGVYDADVTYADEGYAGQDTYVWLPVSTAVVKYSDAAVAHVEVGTYGDVTLVADAGNSSIDLEIPISWERPYGREYKFVSATIYYISEGDDGFIIKTWFLGRNLLTGGAVSIVSNSTDQKSTTYSSYDVTPADPIAINEEKTPTNIQIEADLDAAGNFVRIYAVRLRLRSHL